MTNLEKWALNTFQAGLVGTWGIALSSERAGRMQSICLMVTGANRSMTSLLARQLSLAGLDFGDCLLPGNQFNPDGYYEDRPVVEFHRLLLHRQNQSWLTATAGATSVSMPKDVDFVQRYAAHRSSMHPVWAVKDPQLSLFAPFWRTALRQTRLLAIFRHPADVCRSVRERSCRVSGNPLESRLARLLAGDPDCAARMWLSYNQAILDAWKSDPSSTAIIGLPWLSQPDLLARMLKERWQLPLPLLTTTILFDAERLAVAPEVLEVGDEKLASDIRTTWQSLKQAEACSPDVEPANSKTRLDIKVTGANCQPVPMPGRISNSLEKSAEGFDLLCMRIRHRIRSFGFPRPKRAATARGVGGAD